MRKFRRNQCPNCRFNRSNFACMGVTTHAYPGELAGTTHAGWTEFKGETKRKCHNFSETNYTRIEAENK